MAQRYNFTLLDRYFQALCAICTFNLFTLTPCASRIVRILHLTVILRKHLTTSTPQIFNVIMQFSHLILPPGGVYSGEGAVP